MLLLSFLVCASFFAFTALSTSAQPLPAPAGWRASASGSSITYQPENLPPGKVFRLTVSPPQPLAGKTLVVWFAAQVQADLQQGGTHAPISDPRPNPDGTLLMLVPYQDAGQRWNAIYAAATSPAGAQLCSMVSNLPPQEMNTFVHSGATIFGETVRQAREAKSSSPSTDRSQSATSGAVRQSNGDQPQDPQLAAGVPNSKIVAIFHEGRGMTTPTGYQYVESVDLLLSDGWEYSGLTGPTEDLHIEASKHSEPQKWHHWRREGNAIYLETNGGWNTLDGDLVRPLESGSLLNKSLVHRSAHTFVGMGGTVGTDRISFYPDGRFERSANVLSGSGTVQASGGFSGSASSTTNRNGTTSSSYGTYSGSGGSVTAHSNHSTSGDGGSAIGTYRVSGYTLELDCANGQVQRFLAFYPFPGKPQIFIGNVTFNVE
jgi:hypothetical protein